MVPSRAGLAVLLAFGLGWVNQGAPLEAVPPDALGWPRLRSAGESNRVQVLESSADLVRWTEAAVFHGGAFEFADATAPTNMTRYFRITSRAKTAADDGRNQLTLPDDPFVVAEYTGLGESGVNWVKFAILRGDETRVWFQDGVKHRFHYDFARLRLAPFIGLSRADFDQLTLHPTNQVAVLGAVLIPGATGGEYGIQIVGAEVYPREDLARWLRLVRAAVRAPAGTRALYVPTFEQSATAHAHRDWLATAGFEVAAADRWLTADAIYSAGWALGRLTFVPTAEIESAYASGRLLPTDILVTDAVPAEIPFVAGIISLAPATPNSHVAILARSWEVPFVWFSAPEMRTNVLSLAGREVALRTESGFFQTATVVDVHGALPVGFRSELLALKAPSKLPHPPRQLLGAFATNVQNLKPDASRFVGGKAANYGLLRRVLPTNSEPAIALTFDLWEAFLDQTMATGRSLRAEVALQLGGLSYPPDFSAVSERLAGIRKLFENRATFSVAQRAAILGALTNAGFDGSRKIRFRSSTNVEDSEDFTGAGLYNSYSGCLLDDLDGDNSGPSACDPKETNERGVFRAIQKVYASFYNANAFLERLRRGVNEAEVGMAVLVHHSYPDEIELANGVATLTWDKAFGSVSLNGRLVSQVGAESITNPDTAARPEVVDFYRSFGSTAVAQRQESGLVPLGGSVMRWETDYQQLVSLLARVADGYSAMFPTKVTFSLDFEYKRLVPGKLDVKQVRPLPQPIAAPITTFLLPGSETLCVDEGEFSDVFAKHRLKSQLRLTTDARRLIDANLATTLFTAGEFTQRAGDEIIGLTNAVSSWPEFRHIRAGDETRDSWAIGSGTHRRVLTLIAGLTRTATPPLAPWVTARDFTFSLEAKYAQPQVTFDFNGGTTTTVTDTVRLVPCPDIRPDSLLQTRTFTKGKINVATQFYWPQPPKGPTAGYTAPNLGFLETRITGLTTEPLILRARAAQTYAPGHHNFWEHFIFEPRLDSNVSANQLVELESINLRQLLMMTEFGSATLSAIDASGKLRPLP
jgi:hypothetical protein